MSKYWRWCVRRGGRCFKPDYADAFSTRGNARDTKDDLEGALQDYNEASQYIAKIPARHNRPRSIELNDASIKSLLSHNHR